MNKHFYFLFFLLTFFSKGIFAQISVINQKGTRFAVDSSKWTLSGTDIYNKNTGNVGLGNPSPTYKLDVTGKVRFTDSLVTNTARIITLSSGSTNDSIVVSDPSTGVLKRISGSNLVGWSLAGNSGTTAGTNFIGTKDIQDLVFKVNNVESGRLNLFNLATSFGYNSIAAYKSTSIGYGATTTTNTESVAIGNNAQAISYQSVAIGSDASTSSGSASAFGNSATAAYQATAIGANTSATGNNSTAIGFGATTTQANALILGNSSVKVGIGTSTPSNTLDINSTANPLKLTGLVSGSSTDSILTVQASGVVRRVNFSATALTSVKYTDTTSMLSPYLRKGDTASMLANYINTASNGLTKSSKDVKLGGTLTAATSIGTSASNTLALTGLQSGSATDSLVTVDASGVLKRITQPGKNTVVKTTTTQATSSTSLTTISTLSFVAQAGKNYRVRVWIVYNAASTGTGIKLGPNTFSGTGDVWYNISVNNTGTTSQQLSGYNTNTPVLSTGSRVTSNNNAFITLDLECATSGTMSFQFGSEISGSAITIQPNSRLDYEITN